MKAYSRRGVRPWIEVLEDRCLLSLAVLEIQNKSTYNITFDFRWTPASNWSQYTESPGQGQIFWTDYSNSLSPQALFSKSSLSGSQATESLVQGYGEYDGSGAPPASAASLYQFQNTASGLDLFYTAPPTPTVAVTEIVNNSSYTITFDYRWNSSASYQSFTESPGQGEIFWINQSSSLAPEALYDTTSSAGSQLDVALAQGYGTWTGNGTPPASTAKQYEYLNTSTGVQLYYGSEAPAPTLSPARNAQPSPNWSGYAIKSSPGSVTQINGSWVVPAVSGPSGVTLDSSTWIGIDGYGGATVEQIGTEQDSINGKTFYQAWYEMYSSEAKQPEQVIPGMIINPGDSISAVVQYLESGSHAGLYELSITDSTRNESYTTYQRSAETQNPAAQNSTAEWIMEAPTVDAKFVQLPNFSPVNFSDATANINGVSGPLGTPGWNATPLNLVTNQIPIDTTSTLDASGESFTVTSNTGVGAQNAVSARIGTSQPQFGSNNPQIITVGRQTPVHNSSLTPTIVSGRLPTVALVAGSKVAPITQRIRITNSSSTALTGDVTVALLLSADPTGVSGGVSAASTSRRVVNLKPGKFITVPVTIRSLPSGVTGNLYILPTVTDPSGNTAFTTSAGAISVAAPFLDLQPLLVRAPVSVKAGKRGVFTLTLINNGNIPAAGDLGIDVQASLDGVIDGTSVDLGTTTRVVSIRPGRKATIALPETFPASGGPYYIVVNVDPGNAFSESDLADKVLASTVTVKLT